MLHHHLALLAGILSLSVLGCAAAPPTAAPAAAAPSSAEAGATTIVAIAPPSTPPGPGPIGRAIGGIGRGLRRIGQGIRNRLGMRFPGLESKPALTAITDPANSGPDADPAAQAAAEIKAAEDGAAQKIKALRYLATIGCSGCYPGIEEAYLSALEDCTEAVRYEAVKAIRSNGGNPCAACTAGSCCSEKLLKKLYALGNDQDDTGCFVEPSARVRRVARICVGNCGGYTETELGDPYPLEGPEPIPTEAAPDALPAPDPAAAEPAPAMAALPDPQSMVRRVDFQSVVPKTNMVVAHVAGESISESDVLLDYVTQHPNLPVPASLKDIPASFARQAIEQAIRRKLIYQEAMRRMPAEQLAELVANAFPQGKEIDSVQRELVVARAWLEQARPGNQQPSEATLQRRFQTEFASRVVPAQARWEQVWVRKSSFPSREAALVTIHHARNRAIGLNEPPPLDFIPSHIHTSVRNWTVLNRVPPTQRGVLNALADGAVSGVVEESDLLIVFRLLEKRPQRQATLADVKTEVVASLSRDSKTHFEKIYTDQLRQKSDVWSILEDSGAEDLLSESATQAASPPLRR